jgi:hypothetical protein
MRTRFTAACSMLSLADSEKNRSDLKPACKADFSPAALVRRRKDLRIRGNLEYANATAFL